MLLFRIILTSDTSDRATVSGWSQKGDASLWLCPGNHERENTIPNVDCFSNKWTSWATLSGGWNLQNYINFVLLCKVKNFLLCRQLSCASLIQWCRRLKDRMLRCFINMSLCRLDLVRKILKRWGLISHPKLKSTLCVYVLWLRKCLLLSQHYIYRHIHCTVTSWSSGWAYTTRAERVEEELYQCSAVHGWLGCLQREDQEHPGRGDYF